MQLCRKSVNQTKIQTFTVYSFQNFIYICWHCFLQKKFSNRSIQNLFSFDKWTCMDSRKLFKKESVEKEAKEY